MFGYCYDFTRMSSDFPIDEGYFDLTPIIRRPAAEIADVRQIHRTISSRISVSEAGAQQAHQQIASKLHKPAAFT